MSHPLTEPVMLAELLPEAALINAHVRAALNEDIGSGDVTASLLPAHQYARAEVITREPAVLSGRAWFDAAFRLLDDELTIEWQAADGEQIEPGQLLCRLHGRLRSLLTAERTALNYLQVLSGTATRAHRYAEAVRGLPVRILDTRKTLPGLRREQKYAVACGGCHNHRMGLFDAILIKENHILAAGSIAAAIQAARDLRVGMAVEIEVESLDELRQAVAAGAERVLLDNFTPDLLRQAVAIAAGRTRLEASGGITLEHLQTIAATGVDDISVGDLTKGVEAVDLSMRLSVRGE
ncbi:MAG TPA: carboxylating nicotinate-nucleotide diphosphorylase [Chromatiaceae bacterium]|jgi:nicotinate-nucleotide pyrophosphorylase (carboxylating)|nr:MAG: carboxylating nicotinate-nucleotide diphosphorylase [Thiohalocapsa sp. PB-PSB1]HBG96113.1 carboxylating nicotinate-nucleotide diphosphorylase [Chromatiaceae bacterium]HCS90071.1 carboxylating nicotinate-nucleotide diphosphorylase [Chromatiaceae bacterium]